MENVQNKVAIKLTEFGSFFKSIMQHQSGDHTVIATTDQNQTSYFEANSNELHNTIENLSYLGIDCSVTD